MYDTAQRVPTQDPTPGTLYSLHFECWPKPDGTFHIDYLTESAADHLECSASELATRLFSRTLPLYGVEEPAFYAAVEQSKVRHEPWRAEFGFLTPRHQHRLWLQLSNFPRISGRGEQYFVGVMVDLTQIKQAEIDNEQRLRVLTAHLQNSTSAVIEWGADQTILRWSGCAESVFGWSATEKVGRPLLSDGFVHHDDEERVNGIIRNLLNGIESNTICPNRNVDKAGIVHECEWHNSVVLDANGQLVSVLSLVLDITEQKRLQEQLSQSDELLKAALAFTNTFVWERNLLTDRVNATHDYGAFFGCPELGSNPPNDLWISVVLPEDREALIAKVYEAMMSKDQFQAEFRGRSLSETGQPRWFVTQGKIVRDPHGQPVRLFGITKDITTERRAQEEREAFAQQMQETRRFESLGVMAGGLAHDFNNLLTVILGHASLLRSSLTPTLQAATSLSEIETASHRAANLCRQLSAYAGVGRLAVEPIHLPTLVHKCLPLWRTLIGATNIEVQTAHQLPSISGELLHLRQALLDVLLNAIESYAVPTQGEVVVEVESTTIHAGGERDDFQLKPSPGTYQVLRVRDTGSGMKPEVLAKAFDPFYSTKFTGRGLGLSAVYGIVRGHRGGVRLRSEPGRGTTVELFFPVSKPGTTTTPPPSTPEPITVRPQTELAPRRILIVDDDPNIRELMAWFLEDEGFSVVVASGGAEALRVLDSGTRDFVLAIVDLTMPGMSGQEVIAQVRTRIPRLPVMIVSGYSDREPSDSLRTSGPTEMLPKPFRIEQFSEVMHRLL